MKEAIVHSVDNVEIVDSPVPAAEPNQIVIKVIFSGSNPKDWKIPMWMSKSHNSGDDIAGIVHAVGAKVYEFKAGDRVAAFHEMRTAGGSFAEYAVAWQHTTFHLPEHISFEEAATVPLAAMTAAVGLYVRMGLKEPWKAKKDDHERTPIIVYGAASAVGAYAIQLARASNLHPIIGVAGKGIPFAESLIDTSAGDAIIDYRHGDDAIVSGISSALRKAGVASGKAHYAFDAISEHGSVENLCAVLEPQGSHATCVLPWAQFAKTKDFSWPAGIQGSLTQVGCVHAEEKDFGQVFFRYFARLMEDGRFKGHPYEVVPGGLAGVGKGLTDLKEGKASAVKFIFNVPDTDGAGKE